MFCFLTNNFYLGQFSFEFVPIRIDSFRKYLSNFWTLLIQFSIRNNERYLSVLQKLMKTNDYVQSTLKTTLDQNKFKQF